MRRRALLAAFLLSGFALAQSGRPALTTRKEFAATNLLFAVEDIIGAVEVTRNCITIQQDGRFHRETGSTEFGAKFGETGRVSESELRQLKAMIEDSEFKNFRHSGDDYPKTAGFKIGDQTFRLTVVRDGTHSQYLFYKSNPAFADEPHKVRQLNKLLRDLETRNDSSLKRVPADGCRQRVNPVPAKP
jgi:hypothetical protein